jgi:hypothetical protein
MKTLLLLPLLLTGCKSTTVSWIEPYTLDGAGKEVRITDRRFFLTSSAAVSYEVSSNGVRRITFNGASQGDAEALRALARGLAEGMKP